MALIGSWVPAKSSQIGMVDRIFSRVQSRETCSTNNSSFAIDLNQVAVMLRCSTRKSLLLIDEFGKGTNSSDGIALLAATIRSLASRCNDLVKMTQYSFQYYYDQMITSTGWIICHVYPKLDIVCSLFWK